MSNENQVATANAQPSAEADDDLSYAYNEASALHADDAANRISDGGAYVGHFTKAEAVTAQSGTHGIAFAFESPGQGNAEFTLYTKKEDGTEVFGMNQVNAIMYLLGLKSLRPMRAKVTQWVDVGNDKREQKEVDGKVFPDVLNKQIGIVLEKELTTRKGGGDGARMNLHGLFQAESKLMMSELKEKKTVPVKLDRLLKGLKVKDTRKAAAPESAQPSMGGVDGY